MNEVNQSAGMDATRELSQIVARVHEIASMVAGIDTAARDIADRLFDAQPMTADDAKTPQDGRAGSIGDLHRALDAVDSLVRSCGHEVSRLHNL